MKNILYIVLIGFVFGLFACEQDPEIYDGPEIVSFTDGITGVYYVQEVDDPGFNVQIGVTTISSTDRTYSFTISGDATEGEQFNLASTSVTVPAGSAVANIVVNGLYAGFTGQIDTLNITLTGESVGTFDTEYSLIMQRYCPFIIDDMVGLYDFNSVFFEDTWTVELVKVDENTLMALDLYEAGFNVEIDFDDSDPANFMTTVAKQPTWVSGTYGQASSEGTGSFSSCDQTITLNLLQTVAAGSFGTFTEVLVKQ